MIAPSRLYGRLRHLLTRRIWQSDVLGERSLRGRWFAVLRIAAMTWNGVRENSLASRAGALSYSSMLGLGPMVALVVLVSGAVLQRNDPDFVIRQLNRGLEFIAPQLRQLRDLPPAAEDGAADPGAVMPDGGEEVQVNPDLVRLLNGVIQGSQSKTIGILGAFALFLIVIQLFTSIENAFNEIWGVRRGRNWMLRIVFYWTAVTLGAVLLFASLTLLSTATFVNMVLTLPGGSELQRFYVFAGPAISMGVLLAVLTVFYKFIPNTSVNWRAALVGSILVVLMLLLNNLLAFAYVRQVVVSQSLYGSIALLAVLMIGLYVFWFIILIGGQITYAWQNANYRSSNMAWHDLNFESRQGIALLVFVLVARRFRDCRPALNTPEISDLIKIPTQVLNACLERLMRTGLVSRIPPEDAKASQDYRFQPARPLERVTLGEFKELFEGLGEGPTRDILDSLDPVVRDFHARLRQATRDVLGSESINAVIERLPAGTLLPDPGQTTSGAAV